MVKKYRRITDSDIKAIVLEIDRWALGQLGSKFKWEILEESTGIRRQSLQAKPEIKAAYDNAKAALRGGLVKSKEQTTTENEELRCEVHRLQKELKAYKEKELKWFERWQRIAFHVGQSGLQVSDIDKEIHEGAEKPSKRKTADILRPFDKDIPPTGRI